MAHRGLILALAGIALAGATGAIGGYSAGRASVAVPPQAGPLPFTFAEGRAETALRLAAQTGDVDTLIIGDSLVEITNFSGACGTTFQAGIGGSRVTEALTVLPGLIEQLEPETVIISIGTNYFITSDEMSDLQASYPDLVAAAKADRVILVGISNSERGNAYIQSVAAREGHEFLAPPDGPMLDDGIHYNTQGAIAFRGAVARVCGAGPRG